MRPTLVPVLSLALIALPVGPAFADDDADAAREGVQRGQILPLERILRRLERTRPGQILEIELDSDDGVWEYEIEMVTPRGRLVTVSIDARTGRFLGEESDDD